MSFDVFLQRFRPGELNSDVVLDLLKPYLAEAPQERFYELHFDDGDAAIYGLGDPRSGFMVNRVSGRQAWDVLVAVARQGDLAILPVGCPTAVTSEDLIPDLPEEMQHDARVIRSGEDLVRLIESA